MPTVGNGISVLIVLLTALIIGGSKSRNTLKLMFGKGGITVGNDIPREDVKGFSYIDSQNNKEYKFIIEKGSKLFLCDSSEFLDVDEDKWAELLDILEGGLVEKRKKSEVSESVTQHLHWNGDQKKFRSFKFKDDSAKARFESFCESF